MRFMLNLPNLSALVGTRVNVPIQIDDATGLQAGGIVLNYDSKVLHAIRVFSTPILSGNYWKSNVEETGEVRMAFASGQPLAGNGALFSIEFEVMPALYQDEISLCLAQAQFGEQHTVTVRNGSIQIVPRRTELLSNYSIPSTRKPGYPTCLLKMRLLGSISTMRRDKWFEPLTLAIKVQAFMRVKDEPSIGMVGTILVNR